MTDYKSTDPEGPIVMLATPAYGGIMPLHELSVLENMRDLARRGYRTRRTHAVGNPLLPYARANLFGQFVRVGDEWCTMVDNDIGFPETLIGDMIEWGKRHGKTMMSAIAPMRTIDLEKAIACQSAIEAVSWAVTPGPDALRVREKLDGFIPAQCVGTGLVVMHRSAALELAEAHPELAYDEGDLETWSLFHIFIHNRRNVPEDVAFFDRWRMLGTDREIWVKEDAFMTHTGPMTVGANLKDALSGEGKVFASAADGKMREHR